MTVLIAQSVPHTRHDHAWTLGEASAIGCTPVVVSQ